MELTEFDPLASPYNFCDRRCERCPLTDSCDLAIRERRREWAHRARGLDPDDPEVFAADLAGDLAVTTRMLEEDGTPIDQGPPEPRAVARWRSSSSCCRSCSVRR